MLLTRTIDVLSMNDVVFIMYDNMNVMCVVPSPATWIKCRPLAKGQLLVGSCSHRFTWPVLQQGGHSTCETCGKAYGDTICRMASIITITKAKATG